MNVQDCIPAVSICLTMEKEGVTSIYIVSPVRMHEERCFDIQEAFDVMLKKMSEGFRLIEAETYVYLSPVLLPMHRLSLFQVVAR